MAELTPVARKFILHWGEMGTRWGVNRSVAQIHALLFLSPKPLHAEEISSTLALARSTVSASLRELQGWGIIRSAHVLGDRRDHYTSPQDVWEMFRTVLAERKRREVDPTLLVLRECVAQLKQSRQESAHARRKLAEMLDFFETVTGLYEQIRPLATPALVRFARMGDGIRRLLGS
ncbi:MAG: GbsR/MarR family transcriptional regulator [Anaerolineales bacterium]